MKKYLLHIKVLPHPYVHDIWMNSQGNRSEEHTSELQSRI